MSLNESIIKIRVELQKAKLNKSGHNNFAGFDYFELKDFLPKLNELMLQEGINDRFFIGKDMAFLELIKGEESQIYSIPFMMFATPMTYKKDRRGNFLRDENGSPIQVPSMQDIQYLGALNTYYKRYLYINAFGITDGEIIDSMDNGQTETRERLATAKQVDMIKKSLKQETIAKILAEAGVEYLEDLTIKQASDLIGKIKKQEERA